MKEIVTVDLGGTFLRVGKVRNKKLVLYQRFKTPKSKKEILDLMCQEIQKQITSNTKGIGVACAGAIDSKSGIIKKSPNLPISGLNLKKFLRNKFKKRVEIENDANCVALAEKELGYKKKNFFVLTLGTGIGGGIVINGELYKGQGLAGELGHILIQGDKDLEELASYKTRQKEIKRYFGKELWIKDLIKSNNKNARKIINSFSLHLGRGIASLVSVFDPEIVVLSGGVTEAGKKLLQKIRQETYKHSFLPRKTPIEFTKLKHVGSLGAGLLI